MYDQRTFILQNVPPGYDSELVKDYIEANLDKDVDKIIAYPFIQGRFLFTLKEDLTDFNSAFEIVKKEKIDDQIIILLKTKTMPAVIVVTHIDFQKLEEEFLKLYLECTFGNNENIIQKCDSWPDLKVAVVHFNKEQQSVVERILAKNDHIPLPSEDYHISVSPYFLDFHDHIDLTPAIPKTLAKETSLSSLSQGISDDQDSSEEESYNATGNKLLTKCKKNNGKKNSKSCNFDYVPTKTSESVEGKLFSAAEKDTKARRRQSETLTYKFAQPGQAFNKNKDEMSDSDQDNDDTEEDEDAEDVNGDEVDNDSQDDNDSEKNKMDVCGENISDDGETEANENKNCISDKKGFNNRGQKAYFLKTGNDMHRLKSSHHDDNTVQGRFDFLSSIRGASYSNARIMNTGNFARGKRGNFRGCFRGRSELHKFSTQSRDIEANSDSEKRQDTSQIRSADIKRNNRHQNIVNRGRGARGGRGQNNSIHAHARNPSNINLDTNVDLGKQTFPVGPAVGQQKRKKKNTTPPHYKSQSNLMEIKKFTKSSTDLKNTESDAKTKSNLIYPESIKRRNSEGITNVCKIDISALQYKCLQPYLKSLDLSQCKVKYNNEDNVVVLKGSYQSVNKCHLELLKELKKIKETSVPICDDVQQLLFTEKGKLVLSELRNSDFPASFIEHDVVSKSIKIASYDEMIVTKAEQTIKEKLEYTETIKGKRDIPDDKISLLKYNIFQCNLLVKIKWEDKSCNFTILGIKDHVLLAMKEVEKFLEDFGIFDKSFDVGKPLAKYFCFLQDHIHTILKEVTLLSPPKFEEHQVCLRFQGNKFETSNAIKKLQELKGQVKFIKWNLMSTFKEHEVFLIANSFKRGVLKDSVEKYQYKYKCLIDTSHLSSLNMISPNTKKVKPSRKSKLTFHATKSTIPLQPKVNHKIIYRMTQTCQLIIKPYGDVVKEKSDVLVSILGTNLDLTKTRVGISFQKNCPVHSNEVKRSYLTNRNPSVVTVNKPQGLNCLAVCHVILEPWDPHTSENKLSQAIQQVFNEARQVGARSISFPALGCGAAFKFPSSHVANIIFKNFNMSMDRNLERIVLLAPDPTFFSDLNSQASKLYRAHHQAPIAVPTSVAQDNEVEDTSDDSSEDSDDELLKIDYPSQEKTQCSTELVIMALNHHDVDDLKKQVQQEIKEKCLHIDYFNQDVLKFWPRESRKKIIDNAKKLAVWVERSRHPKTKYIGYIIKGEKTAVYDMKIFIDREFQEASKHMPRRTLFSSKAPKRGTVEFLEYATQSDELFPSYWSFNQKKNFFLEWFSKKFTERKVLVDVDKETKDAIENLVTKTFDPQLVGQGHDAQGLHHSSLKVIKVQRVENLGLFELYREQRKRLFAKMWNMKRVCCSIDKLRGSKGSVQTKKYLSEAMKNELYSEVNEHYLFHGAKEDCVDTIVNHGLDPKLANEQAMFGKGIYTAERSTKSDQYTDSNPRKRNGQNLTLILARMLLGNVFLCDEKSKFITGNKKLSRPPCMKCYEDKCTCSNQVLFDSVMGNGNWLFREFVVYEASHCYPEYVITYRRS
ncbi:hypothetical protein BgiMline_022738 [Biomphalaria glabrata]|uniref:Poly [ADP-ribose] polymerase n=1 Tax=Biomphalaria glabrata TaxID=6526 RepID=A0A9U8ECA7_BIOGL|nr:uncharacterized protein LOC106066451 [Biomphalaria glabrata]XP_013080934.2 uncharacterized protein LOC106066451 [Biomphalaria glabrata]XP_013080937.2 uncharacterized protein LOC106066451 [Biomphalaria glabrata]XP_055894775.1 uncharacterized protein LOC106066451 [Biomphalaria glabrata]XP_055894776.1 uncharacterized protein LOC106066451 [Biomphalaria glabrata]XP_055894777.1 uncharacterized protein LOC106066451 [Biomphalaria glabrata]XP_055894778.1 uncharacterized protein LOC106066451 [Biomph